MYAKSESLSPVIVLGMHRAGTSLLTRSLEGLGLFMGKDKEMNDESIFFKSLNEWILHSASCAWDEVEKFNGFNYEINQMTLDYLSARMKSVGFVGYSGVFNYRKVRANRIQWGWKDPRNCITLRVWLELFPDAKVLYIKRHGIDVARSLQKRSQEYLERSKRSHPKRLFAYRFKKKKHGFTDSQPLLKLENALLLWSQYMEAAEKTLANQPSECYFELRYEDFLSRPWFVLSELCRFLGLEASSSARKEIVSKVDSTRAFSFRGDPVLLDAAKQYQDLLSRHGY
jgi:hypothetical protein